MEPLVAQSIEVWGGYERTIMARHIIMDSSGHSTIEFDKTNAADLTQAESRFRKLTGKGFLAATPTGAGQHRISEGGRIRPR